MAKLVRPEGIAVDDPAAVQIAPDRRPRAVVIAAVGVAVHEVEQKPEPDDFRGGDDEALVRVDTERIHGSRRDDGRVALVAQRSPRGAEVRACVIRRKHCGDRQAQHDRRAKLHCPRADRCDRVHDAAPYPVLGLRNHQTIARCAVGHT
jgi:hypothetical protein